MYEKDLPSTLDETLAPVNHGRRRFWGKMLAGAAAFTLLLSAAMTTGAQQQQPPPTFSPASGTYSKGQQVVIMNPLPKDAAIFYTLDGSTPEPWPTPSSKTFLGDPIILSITTTIKAIVCLPAGAGCSHMATATYTITAK